MRHFFAGASNQISLMKWLYGIQSDEPGATASMPTLPKTALPGGFSLVIGHFISEIADCTQQQKNAAPAPLLPAPPPPSCFLPPLRLPTLIPSVMITTLNEIYSNFPTLMLELDHCGGRQFCGNILEISVRKHLFCAIPARPFYRACWNARRS